MFRCRHGVQGAVLDLGTKIILKLVKRRIQVYDILKADSRKKNQWLNFSNGSMEWKLRKTLNEDINEIVWECFVCGSSNLQISGPVVQEHVTEVAGKLGKSTFKASNAVVLNIWYMCQAWHIMTLKMRT